MSMNSQTLTYKSTTIRSHIREWTFYIGPKDMETMIKVKSRYSKNIMNRVSYKIYDEGSLVGYYKMFSGKIKKGGVFKKEYFVYELSEIDENSLIKNEEVEKVASHIQQLVDKMNNLNNSKL